MVERLDRILVDLQRLITRRGHLEVDVASVASTDGKGMGCATRDICVVGSNSCGGECQCLRGLEGVKLENGG